MASSSEPSPAEWSLFVLQKIACTLSAFGSLMIISQVSRSQFNRKKTQQRLMLLISLIDFQTSVVWIFTPLFMTNESNYPMAMGSPASCDAQGFIVQFSSAGFLYMCSLQLMYLLIIRYGWKERDILKLEKWFHMIPLAFGIATATAALVMQQYNAADWDCWIAPYPPDCTSSHDIKIGKNPKELETTDCDRGDNANIYRFAFFFAPLWAAISFCIVSMILVHRTMKISEQRSIKYKYTDTKLGSKKSSNVSDEVKRQSIRYSLAFFIVWTFPTLSRIVQRSRPNQTLPSFLIVLSGTTIGMQGLLNAIIYFRPRYSKCVQYDKWYQRVWALIHSTIFFCCYDDDYTKDSLDYVHNNTDSTRASHVSHTESNAGHRLSVGSRFSMVSIKSLDEYPEEKSEVADDEWHENDKEAPATCAPTRDSEGNVE